MIPIPQDRLREILLNGSLRVQQQTSTTERGIPEHVLNYVEEGYENRTAAAFVDDLDSPKSCLIVTTGNSWLTPAPMCKVLLVWIRPEHRTNSPHLLEDIRKTYHAFARLNECEGIYASSWVFLGTPDISPIWSADGFDLQEKVFFKSLVD